MFFIGSVCFCLVQTELCTGKRLAVLVELGNANAVGIDKYLVARNAVNVRIVAVFQLYVLVGIALDTDNSMFVENGGISDQHILNCAVIEILTCEIGFCECYVELGFLSVLLRGDVQRIIGVGNGRERLFVLVSKENLYAVLIKGQALAHFIVNRVGSQLHRRRSRCAVIQREINGVADAYVSKVFIVLGGIGDFLFGSGRIVRNLCRKVDRADRVNPIIVLEIRQNNNGVFNRFYACGEACAFYIVDTLFQIRVGLGFVVGIKNADRDRRSGHGTERGRKTVELVQNVLCLAGLYLVGNAVKERLIGGFKGRCVAVLQLGNLIHLKGVAGLVAVHLEGYFFGFVDQRRRRREGDRG